MKVVLASRNQHKVTEVRRILAQSGVSLDLVGIDDLPIDIPDISETGATFAENALLKAQTVSRMSGEIALADDSGLTVEALNGMPGVLSARWAGRHGDDNANLALLLDQCADVPTARRQAAFVCAVALVSPGEDPVIVEGKVDGFLTTEPKGEGGFGYDPIFVPVGHEQTTAQMSATEKDAISHRGRALRALASRLKVRDSDADIL